MKRRFISLFVMIAMLCAALPVLPASAAYSGTCGSGLTWTLDDAGTLTISGEGSMPNWSSSSVPWYSYRSTIKKVSIEDGVTGIGSYAFDDCSSLTSITIPDSVTSIGEYAFYNCYRLTSITIPDSVTSIGERAFGECSSLTSITIPDSVTSIGERAFYGCSSLTSITIPDSVTSIGERAFSGCSRLKRITIPDSVTSIGNYAFYECSSLTSITIPDSVTSIGNSAFSGCSSLTSITIPDSVTSIGERAFQSCSSLTSITIPGSVTSIGNYAFSGCSSLTSVAIPDSVTSIGNYAFRGCSSLTSITIPDSVTSIGNDAFEYCSSLTSITIPDSVTSIGESAFSYCSSLTSINVSGNNTAYTSKDGVLFDKDMAVVICCPCGKTGEYAIPDSVTSIGESTFFGCSSLTSITIPDGVTSIGNYAFYECSCLTSITIPEGVTSIGNYAFGWCRNLTSISIPDGVTSIGSNAFYGCSSLTSITIPDSVTSIESSAFEYCSRLKDVYYGGSEADWKNILIGIDNTKLTSATIHYAEIIGSGSCGDALTWTLDSMGKLTISGTGDMTAWDSSSSVPWDTYRSDIKKVSIEDGVTGIGSFAFAGCDGIKSIAIPDSAASIGSFAFYNCSGLKSIAVPDSVASIGISAFSGCGSLTDIYYSGLETDWKSIRTGRDNAPLTSATIHYVEITDSGTCGDGLTWMLDANGRLKITGTGDMTGWDSSSKVPWSSYRSAIKKVSVDKGVTGIGSYAFYGCSGITSITIPDRSADIGSYAFYGCGSLISVTIPASVDSIGNKAFYGCGSLTDVYYGGSESDWAKISIGGSNSQLTSAAIHYTEPVFTIIDSGTCGDGLTWTFDDAGTLTISGTGDMTGWDEDWDVPWYQHMSDITAVSVEDGVTGIGSNAFAGCGSLASVTIPDSVASIGSYAFDGCSSLTSVTIPDNVTTIGSSAFSSCSSLATVIIPDSVATIGRYAFNGCSSLTDVYYGGSESDWNNIRIGSSNAPLTSAAIYYTEPEPEPTAEPVNYPYQIGGLSLRSETGAELESAPENTGFIVNVSLTETEERADTDYLFIAVYDNNGHMLSLDYVSADFIKDTAYSLGFHVPAQSAEIGSIKAFVLDSFTDARPLADSKEL